MGVFLERGEHRLRSALVGFEAQPLELVLVLHRAQGVRNGGGEQLLRHDLVLRTHIGIRGEVGNDIMERRRSTR